jgi:hypothetical protein
MLVLTPHTLLLVPPPPSQVVLGSSIDEALQWAQQPGSLAPTAAQLVKDALALKGQPFSSEWLLLGAAAAGFHQVS